MTSYRHASDMTSLQDEVVDPQCCAGTAVVDNIAIAENPSSIAVAPNSTNHNQHDESTNHHQQDESSNHNQHDESSNHHQHDESSNHHQHDESSNHHPHDESTNHHQHDESSNHNQHDESTNHNQHDESTNHNQHDESSNHNQHDESSNHHQPSCARPLPSVPRASSSSGQKAGCESDGGGCACWLRSLSFSATRRSCQAGRQRALPAATLASRIAALLRRQCGRAAGLVRRGRSHVSTCHAAPTAPTASGDQEEEAAAEMEEDGGVEMLGITEGWQAAWHPLLNGSTLTPTQQMSAAEASLTRRTDLPSIIDKVKDCGWYWGPTSSAEAESVLATEPDGSFIVRDSGDQRYLFSLTFRLHTMVRHVRIEHDNGNFSFGGAHKFRSDTIVDFIENAVDYSRSGRYLFFLHRRPAHGPVRVQLLHPVSRFKHVQSLRHITRFVILKRVRRDHIDSLPLPPALLLYLKSPHYMSERLEP